MKILYVVRVAPYVPSPGGLTRTFHLVRAATGIADVTLLAAADDPATARLDMLAPLCARIHLVPPPTPPSAAATQARPLPRPLGRVAAGVRALTRANPYPQGQIDRAAVRAAVRDRLRTERYDLVVVEYSEIAALLRDVCHAWGGPRIADLHNIDFALARRKHHLQRQQSRRRRPSIGAWRSIRQLRRIERDIIRSYTRVTAVSEVDAALLRRLAPGKTVDVVPNGVDIDYFGAVETWPREGTAATAQPETLVFTGSLWYTPNVDALRYFLGEIWPAIRRRRPGARFHIVGHDPLPEVRAMAAREGVAVFGPVDDVRPYLANAAVAVVPLRLGSGTRLKILEALAARRPVVSTTLGAEGLDLAPGRDLLLADTPDAFADAVVSLLAQPAHARELADHGRDTVRHCYGWDDSAARFQAVLRDMAARGTPR